MYFNSIWITHLSDIDLIKIFSSKYPSTIKNIIQLSTIMLNKHNNND